MAERDREPTTFLSLPREIRQRILFNSIRPQQVQQDFIFNKRLLSLDNNIMAIILSYTSGTNTYLSETSEKTDIDTFDNFCTAVHQLRDYGIIPAHLVGYAEKLASLHSTIREDMPWVLRNWLGMLIINLLAFISPAPTPTHEEPIRRQSIYVAEAFGGRRRVDKFTKQGLKSTKAYRIAIRKAINTFNAEWKLTGLVLLGPSFQRYSPNVKNFVG
ncbi:hypothetical protein BLS_009519 [Venturia inaequalis]|uniref:Uncharacterized protein n=1 Tax=Venturia inaequalis TaxID=5025 RepID=A0A8H3YNI4_VENIN|nr:hypothetical protein EG328_009108 [Venturia inaequalis]KAE9979706.1 hypothetical protein BLS_009519 [Venturia inaequalis]KAE9980821.1 hypothetical protein EG327_006432 [Venturia inaequalis]RDI76804.1 hypothetical protein Vi05172_g13206 [Venturia inaequalis]